MAILPLSGKILWTLPLGSVFACLVVNILLWVKFSLLYMLFINVRLLGFFSKLCFQLITSPSAPPSLETVGRGKGSALSGFDFLVDFKPTHYLDGQSCL